MAPASPDKGGKFLQGFDTCFTPFHNSPEFRERAIFIESALHDDRIQPPSELAADCFQNPHLAESKFRVEANRSSIGGISNNSDHLAVAFRFAEFNQAAQQKLTHSASAHIGANVNRVFYSETIRWSRSIDASIGIAGHNAIHFDDEIGESLRKDFEPSAIHLGAVRRLDLERSRTVPNVVRVDIRDGVDV